MIKLTPAQIADLPPYVRMEDDKGGACCLKRNGATYWKPTGAWIVCVRDQDGQLVAFSDNPHLKHVNGNKLIPCSQEDFRRDNRGYV